MNVIGDLREKYGLAGSDTEKPEKNCPRIHPDIQQSKHA